MFKRRHLLQAGLGVATLSTLLGPVGSAPSWPQAQTRLRLLWWGSKERSDRTVRVNELYAKAHPGATVDGESLGWSDYWPKLATQVVGRNAPDVIQMDYRYLFEYARRGTLAAFDPFMPKILDIADFGAQATDVGRVNGKLYGVNFGSNSAGTVYNTKAFEVAGIAPPNADTTWDQLATIGEQMTKKSGRSDYYGVSDSGMREAILEIYLRQRGKQLYTADEKLGFDAGDIEAWLTMWDEMRQRKAIPPADVAAAYKDSVETSSLSLGKAALDFPHSNQLVAYQQMSRDPLAITMIPNLGTGSKPGQYLKPSQFLSIYARSQRLEEATRFVDFCVTDPEAGKVLGVERGVPASKAQRAAIAGSLDAVDKAQVDYIDLVSSRMGDNPPPPPKGAGEIALSLRRFNELVGFGRMKPREAAAQFVSDAKDVLDRG